MVTVVVVVRVVTDLTAVAMNPLKSHFTTKIAKKLNYESFVLDSFAL